LTLREGAAASSRFILGERLRGMRARVEQLLQDLGYTARTTAPATLDSLYYRQ
jgi:hypothetical protein